MPEIGRWNGMDQLSESYVSMSPYSYVGGNPVSHADVDGRWFDGDGNIIDTGGQTFGFLGSSVKSPYATNYLGDGNSGITGGDYIPFGDTKAYADLMEAWRKGGEAGLTNNNGLLSWWTDYEGAKYGEVNFMMLKSNGYDIDWYKTSQGFRKWSGYAYSANKFIFQPAADRAALYGAGRIYSTTNLVFEKALPKILGSSKIYLPIMEISAIKAQRLAAGTKYAGRVLGGVGIAVAGADILSNGANTSNSLDLVMSVLAVSPTGWGQAIAGAYFVANGITTLVTGKDIGQHIDDAVNKYYNDGVRAEEQRKFNAAMGY